MSPRMNKSRISEFAAKCFENVSRVCGKLSLIPLEKMQCGEFIVGPWLRLFKFFGILAVGFICCIYKLWACINILKREEINVRTFACVASFLVSLVPWIPSLSLAFVFQGTSNLLNSWPYVQRCVPKLGRHGSGLKYPTTGSLSALTVSGLAFLPAWMAAAGGMLLFFFENLPVSWVFQLQSCGWAPSQDSTGESSLALYFRVLSCMVESGILLIMWYPPTFMLSVALIGFGLGQNFGANIASLAPYNMTDRQKQDKSYGALLVYIRVLEVYLRAVLAPALGAGTLGVIVAVFVTVKYTQLPLHVYVFFPGAAAAGTILTFFIIYEGIRLAKISDGIKFKLGSVDQSSFVRTTRLELKYINRRARAYRPVALPIYDFGTCSIGVMFGLASGILNQVVFLLTL